MSHTIRQKQNVFFLPTLWRNAQKRQQYHLLRLKHFQRSEMVNPCQRPLQQSQFQIGIYQEEPATLPTHHKKKCILSFSQIYTRIWSSYLGPPLQNGHRQGRENTKQGNQIYSKRLPLQGPRMCRAYEAPTTSPNSSGSPQRYSTYSIFQNCTRSYTCHRDQKPHRINKL